MEFLKRVVAAAADLDAGDWAMVVFAAWGAVLLALTFFDRSQDGRPLDKRMPAVDGPIAFLRRLTGKQADRDRDGRGGQA